MADALLVKLSYHPRNFLKVFDAVKQQPGKTFFFDVSISKIYKTAAGKLGVRTRFAFGKLISFDDKTAS